MLFLDLRPKSRIQRVLPTREHNTEHHDYFVGEGVVIRDRDELEIVDSHGQALFVRPYHAEIICRDQPCGDEAHAFFEESTLGKRVYVSWDYIPVRGNHTRGNILLEDFQSLDDLLVQHGYAFPLDDDRSAANGFAAWAKSQGYGIWGTPDPLPPALWRKNSRNLFARLCRHVG